VGQRPRSAPFPYTALFRSRHDAPLDPPALADGEQLRVADVVAAQAPRHDLGDHERSRRAAREIEDGMIRLLHRVENRGPQAVRLDRKSTRLNSSHVKISYA